MKHLISISIMLFLCLQLKAQVTLNKDFNTGTITQGIFLTSGLCNQPTDGYLTDSFSTDGGKSFRTEVKLTDITCGYSKRSEMNIPVANTVSKTAEWFAFETYVPLWQENDIKVEGFVQYHTLSPNPPPFLLAHENGVYQFRQWYKHDGVTITNLVQPVGSFPKGQWNKWVVHYKRSLGIDGLIELWCNGTRLISKTGPNACLENGAIEPTGYFKFGMYKWVNSGSSPSLHGSRVVYIDNVKVGNATATINDFVTANTPPVNLSLSGTNNVCSNGTAGSINSAVSGGTPPFTYLWSNGAVTANISGLSSGNYSLTVTDAALRTATSSITLTSPALLTATATAGTITTVGGTTSVVVVATGGTPPYSGTGNFTVAAGTYIYPVTDANGCAATASVTVNDPTPGGPLTAVADKSLAEINCYGGNTTVNVSATGGTAPYAGTGVKTVSAGQGSLKIAFTNSTPNVFTLMYSGVGPVNSSKNYVLKFTTLGTTNSGKLRASLRQTATPFAVFTPKQNGVYGTIRKDHQFIFKAPPTQTAASF
ncbi:MAG: heparin lyase I family protein [Chitinophagaceae bacterium]|nr:heparin lyase I family protein [Chitinophagaceae bacterium]